MSARPMKPSPSAALRADVVRRSTSASPTGRAMPNFRPDPVGSVVVATIQSGSTVVPGALPALSADVCSDSSCCFAAGVRRVQLAALADGERHLAALARRRREHRREQLRQIDVGVHLPDELTIALDLDREALARHLRRSFRHGRRYLRRRRRRDRPRRDRRGRDAGGSGRTGGNRRRRRSGHRSRWWRRGNGRGRRGRARDGCRRRVLGPHVDGTRRQLLLQHLDALRHAGHALLDLREDLLFLLERQRVERLAIGHELVEQLTPDQAQIDADALRILRVVDLPGRRLARSARLRRRPDVRRARSHPADRSAGRRRRRDGRRRRRSGSPASRVRPPADRRRRRHEWPTLGTPRHASVRRRAEPASGPRMPRISMLLISSASSPSFRSSSAISGCTTAAGAAGATGGAGAGAGFGTTAAARGSLAAGRVSAGGGSSISVSTR